MKMGETPRGVDKKLHGNNKLKTATVIRPLLQQFLSKTSRGKYCGAILFDIKGDFIAEAITLSKRAGRKIEVIGIGHKGVNLCKGLSPEMASTFLKSVFFLSGSKSGESFWIDTATILAKNAFGILSFCGDDKYNLLSLYEYCFDEEKRIDFTKQAFAELAKRRSNAKTESEISACVREERLLDTYASYYDKNFCKLEPKLQTGVTSSLSQILENFTHPDLVDNFCTDNDNNADLEDIINKGTVFGVSLDLSRWGLCGSAVITFIKLRYFNLIKQRANRKVDKPGLPALEQNRLCVYVFDEMQRGISASNTGISDLDFWDTARSARNVGLVATQSYSSIKAVCGENTDVILQNFRGAQILLRSEDEPTLKRFEYLGGKPLVERESETIGDNASNSSGSMGVNKGSSNSQSVSIHEQSVVDVQLIKSMPMGKGLLFANINNEAWDDVIEMEKVFL